MGTYASHPNKEIDVLEKVLHPESSRKKVRPGKESDCDDPCRLNYGRHGKVLLPESLDPNDYNANVPYSDKQLTTAPQSMFITPVSKVQHYSTIDYIVDFRSDEYGQSMYSTINAWRCGDRFLDLSQAVLNVRYINPMVFFNCVVAEPGEEPNEPYTGLLRHTSEFFAERKQVGQLRDNLFYSAKFASDPYPHTGPIHRNIDPIE